MMKERSFKWSGEAVRQDSWNAEYEEGKVVMNRILIIDQTEECSQPMAAFLIECGYSVSTAENVFRAAGILHKEKFDLILCSQALFFESKSPLKGIILDDTRHSKIILLQEQWEETLDAFESSRIIGQILKPVNQEKLLEVISAQVHTTGFTGMVNDIAITDYLQLLAMNKVTKAFVVEGGAVDGVMVLHKGDLIYSEYGEFRGDLAFHALLSLEYGRIVDKQLKRIPPGNVSSSLEKLLLEAGRNRDESKVTDTESMADFLIEESCSAPLEHQVLHSEGVSDLQQHFGRGGMLLGFALLVVLGTLGGFLWNLSTATDSTDNQFSDMLATVSALSSEVSPPAGDKAPEPVAMAETVATAPGTGGDTVSQGVLTAAIDSKPTADVTREQKKETVLMESPVEAVTILRLHGSNTIGSSLVVNLASDYLSRRRGGRDINVREGQKNVEKIITAETENGPVAIEIFAHGSSTGFRDLAAGSCDIAMASRKIKEKEVKLLQALGDMTAPEAEHILALDGIAVIVNKSNPIKTLSIEQIAAIFSGEITDWSELTAGKHRGRIQVYARDGKSGTYDTFKGIVLKKQQLVSGAIRYESNADLSDDVATDRLGIGFTGLPYIRRSKAVSVSDLGTMAIYPNFFTVATEDYLLARRLYLYVPQKSTNQTAADFIDYSLTAPGQIVVNDTGFVDLGIRSFATGVDTDGLIIQNRVVFEHYASETKDKKRLSLNFRFRANSTDLDNRALRDLDRMVEFLKNQPIDSVTLIGFADSKGEYQYNTNLALERSKVVRRELKSRGIPISSVISASEEMPVSSNMTTRGREKNRRVEVWVRLNNV